MLSEPLSVLSSLFRLPFDSNGLKRLLHLSPEMTIAFAHGTFNITNTIIQFPFIGALAYFVTKLIPGEDEVVKYEPPLLG